MSFFLKFLYLYYVSHAVGMIYMLVFALPHWLGFPVLVVSGCDIKPHLLVVMVTVL
jgi:hypothetical protein